MVRLSLPGKYLYAIAVYELSKSAGVTGETEGSGVLKWPPRVLFKLFSGVEQSWGLNSDNSNTVLYQQTVIHLGTHAMLMPLTLLPVRQTAGRALVKAHTSSEAQGADWPENVKKVLS